MPEIHPKMTRRKLQKSARKTSQGKGRAPLPGVKTDARHAQATDKCGHGANRQLAGQIAERERVEGVLRQAQRLEAVGQLAAGVAHEVNNPTSYVRSNLLLLREYWQKPAEERASIHGDGAELIDESLEGVERIASIVQQIGRFSRGAGDERERADLNLILDAALRMARPRLGEVTIERSPSALPEIDCAPRELEQVFLNLLLNAADAVGDAGTIHVASAVVGARARVDVADDGSGIAPEQLARVFDPFFTTKPVGKGTGLGLAISYEIVQRHGGEIEVRSELGRGTVFSVWLPLAAA
jgi:signal transduction histidine kinase